MFGKKQIKILEEKLEEANRMLMVKETHLKNTEEFYKKKLDDLYSLDVTNSDFEFDFKTTLAFSIERIQSNLVDGRVIPKTVIGYINPQGYIGNWSFYCSPEQHQKLAEQFRKYIGKSK